MPWLGCSATLDPATLAEVRDLSGFDPSIRIQRTSIDRPNIMFAIRPMQHPINSFHDLEFLIELVRAVVKQAVNKRRESIAREAFKGSGSKATA